MTDEQMDEIRLYANQYIESWLERIRLKLGGGLHAFQTGPDQVLCLDQVRRETFEEEAVVEPWSVAFYGFSVATDQGQYSSPDGEMVSWNNTNTSNDGLLLTAGAGGITSNVGLIDRIAFYQVLEAPTSGFAQFSQVIYIRIPVFQFPVRLVLRVTVNYPDGTADVSEDTLTFLTGDEQDYEILQDSEGTKLVTAIDVIRL